MTPDTSMHSPDLDVDDYGGSYSSVCAVVPLYGDIYLTQTSQ